MNNQHMTDDQLTDRDKAFLEFERDTFSTEGRKEEAIRSRFNLSPARYYQLLNVLMDTSAALAYDAVLVHRLIDRRNTKVAARLSRRMKPKQ